MLKKNACYGLLLLLALWGCSGPSSSETELSAAIDQEVQALTTVEDHKQYLEQIEADDQGIRQGNRGAMLKLQYGEDSEEYREYVQSFMAQDARNLLKIQAYLDQHGYPQWTEVGYQAASTPWLVVHHSSDPALRNSFFELFYRAYRNGNIDDNQFTMYLNRTYALLHGDLLTLESPYTTQEQIDTLVKLLDLSEELARAEE